jgi:hypothetical protein
MLSRRVAKARYVEECIVSERAPPRGRMVHKRKLRLAAAAEVVPGPRVFPSLSMSASCCAAGLGSLFALGAVRRQAITRRPSDLPGEAATSLSNYEAGVWTTLRKPNQVDPEGSVASDLFNSTSTSIGSNFSDAGDVDMWDRETSHAP